MRLSNFTIVSALIAIGNAAAADYCKGTDGNNIPFMEVSASEPDAIALNRPFELYRTMLGGSNNGNNITILTTGHRQINWDADIVPFKMPSNFFATNVPRGLLLSSSSNKFVVSNPADGTDNLFDSIHPDFAPKLKTFSPKRLITTLGTTIINVEFSVPGAPTTSRAAVQGFGAVFADVTVAKNTKMIFYAKSGCIIAVKYVDTFARGLSFFGGFSDHTNFPIYKVEIHLGSKAIDDKSCSTFACRWLRRYNGNGLTDVVVMDDFLYSEPKLA